MTVFSAANDLLYRDRNLAFDAVYTPVGGEPVAIRMMWEASDTSLSLGGIGARVPHMVAWARVSELSSPRPGDAVMIDAVSYRVGTPERDELRLNWMLPLTKPA